MTYFLPYLCMPCMNFALLKLPINYSKWVLLGKTEIFNGYGVSVASCDKWSINRYNRDEVRFLMDFSDGSGNLLIQLCGFIKGFRALPLFSFYLLKLCIHGTFNSIRCVLERCRRCHHLKCHTYSLAVFTSYYHPPSHDGMTSTAI